MSDPLWILRRERDEADAHVRRLQAEVERLRQCLESIRDFKEPPKKQRPDDADWRWIALEAKRAATMALTPPDPEKRRGEA